MLSKIKSEDYLSKNVWLRLLAKRMCRIEVCRINRTYTRPSDSYASVLIHSKADIYICTYMCVLIIYIYIYVPILFRHIFIRRLPQP